MKKIRTFPCHAGFDTTVVCSYLTCVYRHILLENGTVMGFDCWPLRNDAYSDLAASALVQRVYIDRRAQF